MFSIMKNPYFMNCIFVAILNDKIITF